MRTLANADLEHGFGEPEVFLLWRLAFVHASLKKKIVEHLNTSQALL